VMFDRFAGCEGAGVGATMRNPWQPNLWVLLVKTQHSTSPAVTKSATAQQKWDHPRFREPP